MRHRRELPGSPATPRARRIVGSIGLTVGLVAAAALGCSNDPSASPSTPSAPATSAPASPSVGAKVTIKDFAFGPKSVTVKAGQTVEFTNADTAPHEPSQGTPGTKGPTFDLPTAAGETDTTPALAAGTYPYYCALHEYMKGEILVQ